MNHVHAAIGAAIDQYNLPLVAVAICICAIACFTVVNLLARVHDVPRLQAALWLPAAALTFGLGVWATHFLAMLAFHAGMPVAYSVPETINSVVIAAIGSLLALIAWFLAPARWAGALLGGIILGLSIGGMHYTGVAAMRMPGYMSLNAAEVWASVGIGCALSTLALARFNSQRGARRRLEVTFWLTLAICGLHFTGMAALRITVCAPASQPAATIMGTSSLAVVVSSCSLAVLIIGLAALLMERVLARRAAQEDHRLTLMNNLAREALIIHRNGRILEANAAAGSLLGDPAEHLAGRELSALFAADSAATLKRQATQPNQHIWPEEMQVITGAGQLVPVEITSQTISFRRAPATVMILRDLSDRKHSEARISHLAHHDILTDLPSRSLLLERLQKTLMLASMGGTGAAVLYLDLDRFKPVNDLLGHAGGDEVLVQVAQRLRAETRDSDAVARLGGDEFVMVVANVPSAENIRSLADRLIRSIERPFTIDQRDVRIGVSIGAALYPQDGQDPETLMRAADMAMYHAKASGRGVLQFFDSIMDEIQRERRLLEQELSGAVQRDEFVLHYQPLINCRTHQPDGFEALLRWNNKTRGMMSAGQFIPLAEETGLITKIDHWVIEHACADAASWPAPLQLSVNISPSQFRQAGLPVIVGEALAKSGLDPARLELEITESVLIEDPDRAFKMLSQLRAQGVRLVMDDFGTGYSSLNYLRLFRFDKIKIDRSFVPDLGQSVDAGTIVGAIIDLGHTLGLSVTVEGVETHRQLEEILARNADQVQGFLFARPGPAEAFGGDEAARSARLMRDCAPAKPASRRRRALAP
jgi:diguanylate cyclase (GGDEF)-like protein/PAS domain S-box-containing protein